MDEEDRCERDVVRRHLLMRCVWKEAGVRRGRERGERGQAGELNLRPRAPVLTVPPHPPGTDDECHCSSRRNPAVDEFEPVTEGLGVRKRRAHRHHSGDPDSNEGGPSRESAALQAIRRNEHQRGAGGVERELAAKFDEARESQWHAAANLDVAAGLEHVDRVEVVEQVPVG